MARIKGHLYTWVDFGLTFDSVLYSLMLSAHFVGTVSKVTSWDGGR